MTARSDFNEYLGNERGYPSMWNYVLEHPAESLAEIEASSRRRKASLREVWMGDRSPHGLESAIEFLELEDLRTIAMFAEATRPARRDTDALADITRKAFVERLFEDGVVPGPGDAWFVYVELEHAQPEPVFGEPTFLTWAVEDHGAERVSEMIEAVFESMLNVFDCRWKRNFPPLEQVSAYMDIAFRYGPPGRRHSACRQAIGRLTETIVEGHAKGNYELVTTAEIEAGKAKLRGNVLPLELLYAFAQGGDFMAGRPSLGKAETLRRIMATEGAWRQVEAWRKGSGRANIIQAAEAFGAAGFLPDEMERISVTARSMGTGVER